MKKILIIEEELSTRDLLVYSLQKEGYKVEEASNATQACKLLHEFKPDLVTLGLILPDVDGFDLCRDIKLKYEIPVIVISKKIDRDNRLKAFKMGAYDFMIKPFHVKELLIRIENIFLKENRDNEVGDRKRIELLCGLIIDEPKMEIIDTKNGELINLTPIEYKILLFLVHNKNFVLGRESILTALWENDTSYSTRTVDTHIQRLRNKLGVYRKCIVSVRGIGYKFKDNKLED